MQALSNLLSIATYQLSLDLFSIDASNWASGAMVLFLKGLLILGATGVVAFALRKSAAAIRYMVWCAGLLSLLLLPVLSSALPAWELEMLSEAGLNPSPTTASPDMAPVFPPKLAPRDAVSADMPAAIAPESSPAEAALPSITSTGTSPSL